MKPNSRPKTRKKSAPVASRTKRSQISKSVLDSKSRRFRVAETLTVSGKPVLKRKVLG